MRSRVLFGCGAVVALLGVGCHQHPKLTAKRVPLADECYAGCKKDHEPCGIPFYLPKPLLVVAKNFRYVEEGKVGLYDGPPLPNGFDNQAAYATLNASATVNLSGAKDTLQAQQLNPSVATSTTAGSPASRVYADKGPNVSFPKDQVPSDGLKPDVFYTYQIVFVPDLTQKYVLQFEGGAGEMRAALQLVNGWQFTGLGPFYLKDSSTAQNRMAFGIGANLFSRGVSDAVQTLVNLRGAGGSKLTPQLAVELADKLTQAREETYTQIVPTKIANYAEIRVYEPSLVGGQMEWREIVNQCFDRDVISHVSKTTPTAGGKTAEVVAEMLKASAPDGGGTGVDPAVLRALAGLGTPNPTLVPQASIPAATPAPAGGVVNQQNVNLTEVNRRGLLPQLGGLFDRPAKRRPVTSEAVIDGEIGPTSPVGPGGTGKPPAGGIPPVIPPIPPTGGGGT